ncbi:MAG: hypothetical protein U0264_05230 [Candidatus Kapaibacterium sp.]
MAKFSYNIRANIKTGFGKDALIDDATALGAPLLYTLVPTLLGLQGWLAMFVGFIVPYGLGKLFNIPGMVHAAIGIAGTHLMYSKGQRFVVQMFSKPIWTLEQTPTTFEQGDTTQQSTSTVPGIAVQGLSGVQYIDIGKERFATYNPREIEAQAHSVPSEGISGTTVDDFIPNASSSIPAGLSWKQTDRRKSRAWGKPSYA